MVAISQLRGAEGVRERLLLRAGVSADGCPLPGIRRADALLLVSGSHPFRSALSWTGMLQDSTAALRTAQRLQQQGLLPSQTALWAVANPLLDAPAGLERKVCSNNILDCRA